MALRFQFWNLLRNIKLVVQYKGHCFFGIQRQCNTYTVEDVLSSALRKLYCQDIKITYSGRTDSGVHAYGQVINYKAPFEIPLSGIESFLNNRLNGQILVTHISSEDAEFNSRYTAKSREYHYLFTNGLVPLYLDEYVSKVSFIPDLNCFSSFQELFEGKHDFRNFRKTGSDEKTTVREIYKMNLHCLQHEGLYSKDILTIYRFEISGNAFLRQMVRNIVGALFEYMKGKVDITQLARLLSCQDQRTNEFSAAPAKGLCLVNVNY